MASVAPPLRQHRAAEALFRLGRRGLASLPAPRLAETEMAFPEALRAAVARFARQAPSLLAFAKERAEGHWHTLDGIERVPGDTPRRALLAPVSPQGRRPGCTRVFRPWQRGQALEPMTCLHGHSLVALDGPE